MMVSESNPFVRLEDVNLQFLLYHNKGLSIKELIISKFRFQKANLVEKIWGLKNINLEVSSGDRVGIIGLNGAGKSTLLKTIARIYTPTNGDVEVNGKLAPLIEIGAGFHPELTGKENIILNGLILGFEREEITGKVDDILAFAELAQFADTPVKYYSTGMYMRLAFTIATEVTPDILILDEMFAGGDAGFIEKATKRMRKLVDSTSIVIIVSHDMELVLDMCNRVLIVNHGEIVHDNTPEKAVKFYYNQIIHSDPTKLLTDFRERHQEE